MFLKSKFFSSFFLKNNFKNNFKHFFFRDEKLNPKEKSGTEPQKEQEYKNEEEIYDSEHPSEERKRKLIILCCVSSIILFLIIIGIIALASYEAIRYFTFTPNPPINRINFGSCVSYNNLRQPIWSEGVRYTE